VLEEKDIYVCDECEALWLSREEAGGEGSAWWKYTEERRIEEPWKKVDWVKDYEK